MNASNAILDGFAYLALAIKLDQLGLLHGAENHDVALDLVRTHVVADDAPMVLGDISITAWRAWQFGVQSGRGLHAPYVDSKDCHPRAPRVGDILACSWGYEQTNIDFYQVTRCTKTTVTIVKIAKRQTADHKHTIQVMPVRATGGSAKPLARKFKMAMGVYSGYSCKIESYSTAFLWNGKPEQETGWAYGH